MSDYIKNNNLIHLLSPNLNATPIARKRINTSWSPASCDIIRENKRIRSQQSRNKKKDDANLVSYNNKSPNEIIKISVNGILTDINEISIKNLKELLKKENINHQGSKEELLIKLKKV